MPRSLPRRNWWEQAACKGRDDLPWHYSGAGLLPRGMRRNPKVEEALEVCRGCPVRLDCLAASDLEEPAADRKQIYGIRGGYTVDGRIEYRTGRLRRGA